MINGAHVIIYTRNAEADRAFFRDVLGLNWIDSGRGWLIFALPPAEAAFHAAEDPSHELFLMTDDVAKTVSELNAKGVKCDPIEDARWGLVTRFILPGGSPLALYQPKHQRP